MSLDVQGAVGIGGGRAAPQLILVGDSKTDENYNTWPFTLETVRHAEIVDGGLTDTTVIEWGAPGYVASRCAAGPYFFALLDLGVNDFPSIPDIPTVQDKATFKAAYISILDQLNTLRPGILVFCAYPWARTFDIQADIVAGWIAECIAVRSFARVGHDERIWLKGNDDGATMTTDGTHYSVAGESEIIVQWQSKLPWP